MFYIISGVKILTRSFFTSSFVWINRKCNFAAHTTTKFALNSCLFVCFNKGNPPSAIESVCKEDYPPSFISFV